MAAEEHNGGRSENPTRRVEDSLDSLARDLANGGVSRRKALRLLGGVLLASTLASIPGMALAKPKQGKCTKNSHCPSGKGCSSGWACLGLVPRCGSSSHTCVCTASVEGPVVCASAFCPGRIPCTGSAECEALLGPGSVCQAPISCGCGQACIAPCESASVTSSLSSTGERNKRARQEADHLAY
jgi:hypothetical protein